MLFSLKNVLDEAIKSSFVLNVNNGVYFILIFCVEKLAACTKLFCYAQQSDVWRRSV